MAKKKTGGVRLWGLGAPEGAGGLGSKNAARQAVKVANKTQTTEVRAQGKDQVSRRFCYRVRRVGVGGLGVLAVVEDGKGGTLGCSAGEASCPCAR